VNVMRVTGLQFHCCSVVRMAALLATTNSMNCRCLAGSVVLST
jgi:hypothetical protein